MNRRRFLSAAVLSSVGAAAAPWVQLQAREREVQAVRRPRRSAGFRSGYFPNVSLLTQEGERVRFYDDLLKDKSVVINFMYAKCQGRCTPLTANLVKVQKLLGELVGRNIFFNSISLTPLDDTPEILQRYASRHGVGPGWRFLTGGADDIELLRRRLGFFDSDPVVDADRSEHSGIILYGNESLEKWSACPGLANPAWIAKSLRWTLA